MKSSIFITIILSTFLGQLSLAGNFFFEEFKKEIISKKVTHVREAIPLFPDEYLENYTLMKNSQSLQHSSPLYPRVIMFGNTGQTIYTFNGSSEHQGHKGIETVEASGDNLFFREVVFLADRNLKNKVSTDKDTLAEELGLSADEISYLDSRILISAPNPRKCMACHSANERAYKDHGYARYIWDTYPSWPTAYGAFEDNLVGVIEKNEEFEELPLKVLNSTPHHISSDDKLDSNSKLFQLVQGSNKQLINFLKYKELAKDHPRYKYLNSYDDAYPYSLSLGIYLKAEGDTKIKIGSYNPFLGVSSSFPALRVMPNIRLSTLIEENISNIYVERLKKYSKAVGPVTAKNDICKVLHSKSNSLSDILTFSLDLGRSQLDFGSGLAFKLRPYTTYKYLNLSNYLDPGSIEINFNSPFDSPVYKGGSPQYYRAIRMQYDRSRIDIEDFLEQQCM